MPNACACMARILFGVAISCSPCGIGAQCTPNPAGNPWREASGTAPRGLEDAGNEIATGQDRSASFWFPLRLCVEGLRAFVSSPLHCRTGRSLALCHAQACTHLCNHPTEEGELLMLGDAETRPEPPVICHTEQYLTRGDRKILTGAKGTYAIVPKLFNGAAVTLAPALAKMTCRIEARDEASDLG